MFSLFSYQTPAKFSEAFKAFYAHANVKQIKFLSSIIIAITVITRLFGIFYEESVLQIKGYQEYSLSNWVQMIGAFVFFLLSSQAIKSHNWSIKQKRRLTLSFIIFILLISLGVSYVVSAYNTKNTVTMLLLGIVAVSLFFAVEFKEIILATFVLTIVFILSMVYPKISFEDKLLNVAVAIIFAFILISFSRYNYYFKSQHFIRIKELEDKNFEIQQLNNEKKDILNFVAHDLRNPLNNIESLSNLMMLSEEHSDEATMIANSAKQAKEIINDLLIGVRPSPHYSKTERINLSENLSNTVQRWVTNTQRNVQFIDNSKESYIHINRSKLERVLDNIISNSIKFSASDLPISIVLTNSINQATVKIQDFGIGIPKELQKNIFDQFSKSGRIGLQGEKSTGLGLHISKKIIEEHNGELLMTSEENKGTTFTIVFPLA